MAERVASLGRLRAFLVATSFLLTLAVLVLWARSLGLTDMAVHTRAIEVDGRYARREWTVVSASGFVGVTSARRLPVDEASASWLRELDGKSGLGWSYVCLAPGSPSVDGFLDGLGRLGFPSGVEQLGRTKHAWRSVEVPYWMLLLVVSLPAGVGLWKWTRRRRTRRRSSVALGATGG